MGNYTLLGKWWLPGGIELFWYGQSTGCQGQPATLPEWLLGFFLAPCSSSTPSSLFSKYILYKHVIYIIYIYCYFMILQLLLLSYTIWHESQHQGFTRRPWTATAWCAATPCWRRPNTRRSTRTWRGWSTCPGGCHRGMVKMTETETMLVSTC